MYLEKRGAHSSKECDRSAVSPIKSRVPAEKAAFAKKQLASSTKVAYSATCGRRVSILFSLETQFLVWPALKSSGK